MMRFAMFNHFSVALQMFFKARNECPPRSPVVDVFRTCILGLHLSILMP